MTPIHFTVKKYTKPVTHNLRPVPLTLIPILTENLDDIIREGVLEDSLESEQVTGWLHSIVITSKEWDPS